jgi:glycosyltransferase involved in cell wall biosynthesis
MRLAGALTATGTDVVSIAGRGAPANDVQIVGDEWDGPALERLMRRLDSMSLDHLVLQYTPLMFSEGRWQVDRAVADFWRAASARMPTSLIAHETYFRHWRQPPSLLLGSWQKSILRTLARASGHVFSASEPLVEEMSGWSLRQPAVRLPIGSNSDVALANRAELRRNYALVDNAIVLTLFGCRNNLSLMLRHLQILEDRLHKCGIAHAWLLLGGVPCEILSPRARIISPGWLSSTALSAHLQMSDIFLMPHFQGISAKRGTFMSAMAHGLPVVGTNGKMTDSFWRQIPGVALFEESAVDDFAEGVVALCRDGGLRLEMGSQNAQYFLAHLAWSNIAASFLSAIQRSRKE